MLENKLLLSVAFKDHHIAVETFHDPLELKSVGQYECSGDLVLSRLIKEHILKVHIFIHFTILSIQERYF